MEKRLMEKRLYDIFTKSDIAQNETRMLGRILLDKEGHFEGIISKYNKANFQLITGDLLNEKDYGLVELTIYRSLGDKRPSLKLEGERTNFRFIGKSYLQTNEATVECGNCSIGIQDGELIREVTYEEIDYVENQIHQAIKGLNEDSLAQYMGQSDVKKYRKGMQNV